jgi:MFS superfamily sulfate permease-like transporter
MSSAIPSPGSYFHVLIISRNFINGKIAIRTALKHVVLIFSSVSYIDSTAFEALENLIRSLNNLIMILFYAHWEIKGGLYQNLPINATEIPQ